MSPKWTPLPSETFDIPVHEIRRGYRSDVYFWRAKVALENANNHASGLMQIFQRNESILCGVDEVLALLKLGAGYYSDRELAYKTFDELMIAKKKVRSLYYQSKSQMLEAQKERLEIEQQLDELWIGTSDQLEILTLKDGDALSPWESVMMIDGPLYQFIHLETLYLGVFARRTRIATNVRRVVDAAGKKPVLYFPARFDHWHMQGGDGYAARIGGASVVSTDAQGEWWGTSGAGTIPHALIAACDGDTVAAVSLFSENYPATNLIALVDFENDSVGTSLAVANEMGERLWGVRLDTSNLLVDKSLASEMGAFKPTGVNAMLVHNVRKALNEAGHSHVKIIVSGGFNAERIAAFEEEGVPVDAYGVGSTLMSGSRDFTADIVQLEGRDVSKVGRSYQPNERMSPINL